LKSDEGGENHRVMSYPAGRREYEMGINAHSWDRRGKLSPLERKQGAESCRAVVQCVRHGWRSAAIASSTNKHPRRFGWVYGNPAKVALSWASDRAASSAKASRVRRSVPRRRSLALVGSVTTKGRGSRPARRANRQRVG
jgi:hypothetical protein